MIKNRNGQIFLRNFFLLWASLLFIAGTCNLRNKNPREGQELPENVLNRRSQRGNQEQQQQEQTA
ncbi:MAG: hypothetical protein NQ127_02845, partial [Candidatus Cardinium sp.]|nr:hypothetical protein [Candidatus Cardinium sp.]